MSQFPSANAGNLLLIRAAWIAPMDGPPVRDGAVVFDGESVTAVGDARALRSRYPDAIVHDAGNAVILPGLVNAHTHLELSDRRRPPRPGSFADWLLAVVQGTEGNDPASAALRGAAASLRFGVTTVGDITAFPGVTRPALRNGPLRVVSFGEVRAMAQRRGFLESRLAAAADQSCDGPWLTAGVSPHAPYSVEFAGYERCARVASQRGLPLTTHLAESPDEAAFLSDHAGPLRDLWDALAAWDGEVPRFPGGPIAMAEAAGLLHLPTPVALAHVNYCDGEDLARLAAGGAAVVYCPRTHVWFGHPPHPWRQMLAGGVNVAVGTDSCASSPDLNLVDDLRLLRRLVPDVPAASLWEMATSRAARAIGTASRVGTLAPGKAADYAIFPLRDGTADPLAEVLDGDALPAEVWVGVSSRVPVIRVDGNIMSKCVTGMTRAKHVEEPAQARYHQSGEIIRPAGLNLPLDLGESLWAVKGGMSRLDPEPIG